MTPFGEKIRQLRKLKAISQKQMAQDFDISSAYLSALEHGHRGKPSWAIIQKVICYFDLIWDDAGEIERLASLSDPKVMLDTSGLSPDAMMFVNELAQKIASLSPKRIIEFSELLSQKEG